MVLPILSMPPSSELGVFASVLSSWTSPPSCPRRCPWPALPSSEPLTAIA